MKNPGARAFTRTPVWRKDGEPAREVAHRRLGRRVTATLVSGMKALIEEMLTMTPFPFATIA